MQCLPRVVSTDADFGHFVEFDLKIDAISSDASCSILGDRMINRGDVKLTMGTGTFVNMVTGDDPFPSATGVYPIIAWRFEGQKPVYAAEVSKNKKL